MGRVEEPACYAILRVCLASMYGLLEKTTVISRITRCDSQGSETRSLCDSASAVQTKGRACTVPVRNSPLLRTVQRVNPHWAAKWVLTTPGVPQTEPEPPEVPQLDTALRLPAIQELRLTRFEV